MTEKMLKYKRNGYVLGENLFYTYEADISRPRDIVTMLKWLVFNGNASDIPVRRLEFSSFELYE